MMLHAQVMDTKINGTEKAGDTTSLPDAATAKGLRSEQCAILTRARDIYLRVEGPKSPQGNKCVAFLKQVLSRAHVLHTVTITTVAITTVTPCSPPLLTHFFCLLAFCPSVLFYTLHVPMPVTTMTTTMTTAV
jgi:hypothetical protein